MDNKIKCSVEVTGPFIQALTCFMKRSNPGVRLERLSNRVSTDLETLFGPYRTFNMIPTLNQDADGQSYFVLQSCFNQAYLGFSSDNRRLLMRRMQYPPPSSFRFVFPSNTNSGYDDGVSARFEATDGEPVNDPIEADRQVQLFVRSFQQAIPSRTIDQSWKQQLALISVLGEEDTSDEPAVHSGTRALGSSESNLDNQSELEMVSEMIKTGDLNDAIDALGEQKYDDASNEAISPKTVLKVAQLLCIMNKCLYMRDFEAEKIIYSKMHQHEAEIKRAKQESRPISQAAFNAIEEIQGQGDRATEKIRQVASKMGLKYQPLCNFSSEGKLLRNGPYCGAFYSYTKPFIVVAFKGTGTRGEWITDAKFRMKDAEKSSPLRGKCHLGFFDGIFNDFPCELSTNKSIRMALPFQMIRNQLWKLEREIISHTFPAGLRVQSWTTGHSLGGAYATNLWTGLLGDMQFSHTTVRDLLTFGSPRVGDEAYATNVKNLKAFRKSWRFVNGNDGVPVILCVDLFSGGTYYHVDSLVRISPTLISLGESELRGHLMNQDTEEAQLAIVQDDLSTKGIDLGIFEDHKLDNYWKSLREGALAGPDPWP
ncbi:hypothetical protein EAF04_004402 [Stromatinia cepivora]|nr:hypothetical protein EAF04_004402 [Stromatinia cepivora]